MSADETSDVPIYVPPGDPEFAQAVGRAFPAHEVVTDAKLRKDQSRIGGGPVLEVDQHQIRRPTKPNEYDFYSMDPFFKDLGNLQAKFLGIRSEDSAGLAIVHRIPYRASPSPVSRLVRCDYGDYGIEPRSVQNFQMAFL